ncbi:hypothetical protein B0H14DRAFT_2662178 [Mycena olivaceomarginata]|nr:hypothetical protein B0H14DRAFT_2662178 [Mycena olivaceomarginata]
MYATRPPSYVGPMHSFSRTPFYTALSELQMEGHFQLKESGYTHQTLCLDKVTLWVRDTNNQVCPPSLRFSQKLPTSFQYEGRNYPLPPSHSVELKGIPGFCATINVSSRSIFTRRPALNGSSRPCSTSNYGFLNSERPRHHLVHSSTPRSRPAVPVPSPLLCADADRFVEQPEWELHRSVLKPSSANAEGQNIDMKFYLPASRIFCASQPIPFHLSSDASSPAVFASYTPATTDSNTSSGKVHPATTQVRMMRRTTADTAARHSTPDGAKAKAKAGSDVSTISGRRPSSVHSRAPAQPPSPSPVTSPCPAA